MPANLENSAVATGLEKVSFHSSPKERQCQRMFYHTIVLISHTSQVRLKILQARLQQYVNHKPPDLQDPDDHDGVITHLEPDILEFKVKWVLGIITMNKASGGNGIPVELFQILKDDAVKVLHSICQHIWKTQQWPQDWKRSVFIPVPNKGNAKEWPNYHTTELISHSI